MTLSPHSPRRQRKALYTADTFERRIRMGVPLSRELRARFHHRTVPVHKGDTVRVLSGSFAGREERVARVNRRSYSVTLENVTLKTADEKMKPLSLGVGHLVITRLNLSDPWRRRSMRVRDEDATPEELGEKVAEDEEAPEGEKAPEAAAAAPPSAESPPEPEETPSEDETAGAEDDDEIDAAPAKAPRRARAKPAKEEDA
ncbi:MAG TPA: 50S ribosomal protein L24 [Thermoplasmata archaeon]|jgi:ribosomal protein uL24